MKYEEVT